MRTNTKKRRLAQNTQRVINLRVLRANLRYRCNLKQLQLERCRQIFSNQVLIVRLQFADNRGFGAF